MSRIEGRVARIMTERELVINRGADHGVEVGTRFAILNPNGLEIKDPETGEDLGSVEVAKTIVKVVSVQDRLCVATTFRTTKTAGGALWMAGLANPPVERTETLRTDQTNAYEELSEEESRVKTGDPAVEVTGDAFEGMVVPF